MEVTVGIRDMRTKQAEPIETGSAGKGVPASVMKRNGRSHAGEAAAKSVFTFCGLLSVLAVAVISLYILAAGIPGLVKAGWREILLGTAWRPVAEEPDFGIACMILTSAAGTALALLAAVPAGVLTAVFLVEISGPGTAGIIRTAVELLAGIPSVIYGLLGVYLLNPFLYRLERKLFADSPGHQFTGGANLLSASLILAVMILPTIISVSETSIRRVTQDIRAASYALGASRIQTVFRAVLPAARPGILTGVILGLVRALGEAAAIMMVAGNSVNFPLPFRSVRFLTTTLVSEMGYSRGIHREVLFTVGLVLFVFIMLLNILLNRYLKSRQEGQCG